MRLIPFLLFATSSLMAQPILYSANVDGNWDVFLNDPSTKRVFKITMHPAKDFQAELSPDTLGLVLFDSYRSGGRNIFTRNLNTGELVQLTNLETRDGHPSWSPTGEMIAFQSNRDGNSEVYVMNADGSEQRRVTNSEGFDGIPKWSWTDERLAFNSSRSGTPEVYVLSLETNEAEKIGSGDEEAYLQGWMNEDELLIISAGKLLTRNIESGEDTLLSTPGTVTYARPSKDGAYIIFTMQQEKGTEVFTMLSDGTELEQLTFSGTEKRFPNFFD